MGVFNIFKHPDLPKPNESNSNSDIRYLEKIFDSMELSARAYHKTIKLARTIADLDGSGEIMQQHIGEAVCYRMTEFVK